LHAKRTKRRAGFLAISKVPTERPSIGLGEFEKPQAEWIAAGTDARQTTRALATGHDARSSVMAQSGQMPCDTGRDRSPARSSRPHQAQSIANGWQE
jgi:hypothetical protein